MENQDPHRAISLFVKAAARPAGMLTKHITKYLKISLAIAASIILSACGNTQSHNSASLDSTESKTNVKRVLVVLSARDSLVLEDGHQIPTGFFLDEFAVPAQALAAAGYTLDIATPEGGLPHMDEASANKSYFQDDSVKFHTALNFINNHPGMKKPLKLSDVAASDLFGYKAIFVPGGRAPMVDLMQDPDLGKILRFFHQNQLTTALICHGPVALSAALQDPKAYRNALAHKNKREIDKLSKDWIYSGYRMTIFSNNEEDDALKGKQQKLPFYVADALSFAGAKLQKSAKMWSPFVVRDRELITGQNPASDHALADTLLKVLKAKV